MRAGGVEVAYQVDAEAPTGVCGVLVDPTNERTLVTRLDAANNFTKDHLETAAVQKLLVASKVVYSAGFFLTSGGPDCTALLGQHCADFGKRFCLNISAPFIAQFFGEALDATMPFVDILFANETEAAALGEARGWGSDVATVALKCCDLPKASGRRARCVVFTQGADSTIVACEGAVTTYRDAPRRGLLVDTNGAGDAFGGGFLSLPPWALAGTPRQGGPLRRARSSSASAVPTCGPALLLGARPVVFRRVTTRRTSVVLHAKAPAGGRRWHLA